MRKIFWFLVGLAIALAIGILPARAAAPITPVSGGGTGRNTVSNGAILLGTSTPQQLGQLTIGSTGNILLSNGSAPYWSATSTLNIPVFPAHVDGNYLQASSTAATGYAWATVSGSGCTNNCNLTGWLNVNTTTPTATINLQNTSASTTLAETGYYPTVANSALITDNTFYSNFNPTTNANGSQLFGADFETNFTGQTTPTQVVGTNFGVNLYNTRLGAYFFGSAYTWSINGTASSTGGAPLAIQSVFNNTGTTTSVSEIWITPPDRISGAVGTLTGLEIDSQSATGILSAYGISQNGASDYNYFAGRTGINTSTPAAILAVKASATFSSTPAFLVSTSGNSPIMSVQSGGGVHIYGLTPSWPICTDVNGVMTSCNPLTAVQGGTGFNSYINGQLLIGDSSTGHLDKGTLNGTTNQITVTNGGGSITLSTPQNIDTSATPTFAGLTSTGLVTGTMFSGNSAAPTVATSTGSGTGAGSTKFISGKDNSFFVQIKTGATAPSANAVVATVTFGGSYSPQLICNMSDGAQTDAVLAVAKHVFSTTTSATTLTINSGSTGLDTATTYLWNFNCQQP